MTEVILAGVEDESRFTRIAADVFDEPVRSAEVSQFLADPRHHIVLAVDDDMIVGFASAVHYLHPDKPAELWINEVGVSPAYQGRGVGRRVLERMLEHGASLGCRSGWVLTESDNDAANGLYRACAGELAQGDQVMYEFALDAGRPNRST
jgi:aminoglycoside 6'-N-acetyltransferase I